VAQVGFFPAGLKKGKQNRALCLRVSDAAKDSITFLTRSGSSDQKYCGPDSRHTHCCYANGNLFSSKHISYLLVNRTHRVHTDWQVPIFGVHHDGKISPGW
jgi:hypothetical protein